MADSSSEKLRHRIEAALPDRPFTLRFWDGGGAWHTSSPLD